ncbi:MAG: hypothetical protein KF762_17930 [Acidobacteria bacterium]|nr:hypothetical protein [Acidobacteriota bacterium]
MYKLVLGIVTIGVLQFALMMYLQTQEPPEKQVTQLRPPAVTVRPAAEPQGQNVTEVSSDPGSLNSAEPGNTRRAFRVHHRDSKRHTSRAERQEIATSTPPADFSTVVISYNVPPEKPECGSQDEAKPKRNPNSQFAGPSVPRWKVVKTDTLSFE